ncbi:hypothetical protein D9619_010638 [Psilocybe cf. subviscida]|uniref:Uncharacterized protein n=1 Tax=Psilocybe cf. subviscida TaxID=2480587 RepID=A0A8H5B8U5_9AGAR|nr:hypothetical protein D9619_010638 [Psilocybe cf. subviscida]
MASTISSNSRGRLIRTAGYSAWKALLVYDCIIFGLTIYKSWTARVDHGITGISIPLMAVLLRDGAIYFAVYILTFYFTAPFWRGDLATFASCNKFGSVLVSPRTADFIASNNFGGGGGIAVCY